MKIRNNRIWVCLSGTFEEDVYTASLRHISSVQNEISNKIYPATLCNKLNFYHSIVVGNMAINTGLASNQRLFNGIDISKFQHSHSMTALSDGIYDVLHEHCFYACKPTEISPCVSCYVEESDDGLILYNNLVSQDIKNNFLYGKACIEDVGINIDAINIGNLEFEYWIMVNKINQQTLCNYSIWES